MGRGGDTGRLHIRTWSGLRQGGHHLLVADPTVVWQAPTGTSGPIEGARTRWTARAEMVLRRDGSCD